MGDDDLLPAFRTVIEVAGAGIGGKLTLVGGLIVAVHARRAGVAMNRSTDDMDALVDPQLHGLMSAGNHFKLDSRAFSRLSAVFFVDEPRDGETYIRVLGLDEDKKRSIRWIRRDFITGPDALDKYKIALPKASGSGTFGETLAPPVVLSPSIAVTGTFITIGAFDTEKEAEACLSYLKSKLRGQCSACSRSPKTIWLASGSMSRTRISPRRRISTGRRASLRSIASSTRSTISRLRTSTSSSRM